MATTDEKTITLKLDVPMRTPLQAIYHTGRDYFNEPKITHEHFLTLVENLHHIVTKMDQKAAKKFNMLDPDKDVSQLFSELGRIFLDKIEDYRDIWAYFIRDQIYLGIYPYNIRLFGGIQICFMEELEKADPTLFNVLGRLLSTLMNRFGYYDLENYDEFLATEDSIQDNINMAAEDKDTETVMIFQQIEVEAREIRKGKYRQLIKKIKDMPILETGDCRKIIGDLNHFGENRTTIQRMRKRVCDAISYLPYLDLLEYIPQYAVGNDFIDKDPRLDNMDAYKLRADKNFVLLWKFDSHLWHEVSQRIDDQVNNYGIEKIMSRTLVKNHFPSREILNKIYEINQQFSKYTYFIADCQRIFNDDRLFATYIKKCKENGTDHSPLFYKAKSLVHTLSV